MVIVSGVALANPTEESEVRELSGKESRNSSGATFFWEVLNGVGVDGVGVIFPFFYAFFPFFYAFFPLFYAFFPFFFAFLCFS